MAEPAPALGALLLRLRHYATHGSYHSTEVALRDDVKQVLTAHDALAARLAELEEMLFALESVRAPGFGAAGESTMTEPTPALGAQPPAPQRRGRPRAADPEKYCERCGVQFWRHRHPGGHLESAWKFALRGFCSQACARRAQQKPGTPRAIIARLEADNIAQAARLAAAEAVCTVALRWVAEDAATVLNQPEDWQAIEDALTDAVGAWVAQREVSHAG